MGECFDQRVSFVVAAEHSYFICIEVGHVHHNSAVHYKDNI